MKINTINVENIELTDALRDYVQKKVDMLDKVVSADDESASCDVKMGKVTTHHNQGDDLYFCELNCHVAGQYMTIQKEEGDLYAAIDRTKDELDEKLTSHKNKQQTLLRRGGLKLKKMMRGFRS